ncbi:MAG: putative lipoprotein [Leptospiraceae bacterium]|nr:putative lipoprotein [Leptospiraceae bacterium]
MKYLISIAIALFILNNCSISNAFGRSSDSMGRSSDSMGRSSDSTSNSSKSSSEYLGRSSDVLSNSSRGFSMSIVYSFMSSNKDNNKEKKTTYRLDVKGIAELYSKNLVKDSGFIRDISFVAEKNGITNWKSEKLTYCAIGEGLKKANISMKDFQALKQIISGENLEVRMLLEKGYESDSGSAKNVDLDS